MFLDFNKQLFGLYTWALLYLMWFYFLMISNFYPAITFKQIESISVDMHNSMFLRCSLNCLQLHHYIMWKYIVSNSTLHVVKHF